MGEQVKKISFVLGDGEEKFKKERDATICSENYQDEEEDGLYWDKTDKKIKFYLKFIIINSLLILYIKYKYYF